mmetsp:Transcript_3351/g.7644  ORF Transcript_3351/g.7644 Transcript_3351/m.7644 type:complete len:406 (-) Transcript_3351:374-1591(-)
MAISNHSRVSIEENNRWFVCPASTCGVASFTLRASLSGSHEMDGTPPYRIVIHEVLAVLFQPRRAPGSSENLRRTARPAAGEDAHLGKVVRQAIPGSRNRKDLGRDRPCRGRAEVEQDGLAQHHGRDGPVPDESAVGEGPQQGFSLAAGAGASDVVQVQGNKSGGLGKPLPFVVAASASVRDVPIHDPTAVRCHDRQVDAIKVEVRDAPVAQASGVVAGSEDHHLFSRSFRGVVLQEGRELPVDKIGPLHDPIEFLDHGLGQEVCREIGDPSGFFGQELKGDRVVDLFQLVQDGPRPQNPQVFAGILQADVVTEVQDLKGKIQADLQELLSPGLRGWSAPGGSATAAAGRSTRWSTRAGRAPGRSPLGGGSGRSSPGLLLLLLLLLLLMFLPDGRKKTPCGFGHW